MTPSSSSTRHSTARCTVSNAFLKSTKQQYSLPAFPVSLVCLCLSISDLNMKILSVVRNSFLKPACPLALTAWSLTHDAILCSNIFANSLAITEPTVIPQLLMSDLSPDLYTAVIKPTDRRSGKCPASMQLNSHNKLCFTSSPPSLIISGRTPSMPGLLPRFNRFLHEHSSSIVISLLNASSELGVDTPDGRMSDGSRQGLGSHQGSEGCKL